MSEGLCENCDGPAYVEKGPSGATYSAPCDCPSGRQREWDISPGPDGEPFFDRDGNEILGWHPRTEDQDEISLAAEFEAFYRDMYPDTRSDLSLTLRPILMRPASDVECRIEGWEEGTIVRCTSRAKTSWLYWQIEIPATPEPQEEEVTDAE